MKILAKKSIAIILTIALIVPLSVGLLPFTTYAQSDYESDAAGLGRPQETVDYEYEATLASGAGAAAGGILSCIGLGFLDIGTGGGVILSAVGFNVPTNDFVVSGNTATIKNKECILDGLMTVIKEVLISSMTQSIVNWINNGFEGSPAFVDDLEGFMLDVADQVVGYYIEGSALAFLCSPFKLDVRISLALDYYSTSRSTCTLTGTLDNIEDAFDDFTSEDAWDSWFELSINPNNNAYGSFIGARQQMREEIAAKQAVEAEKLRYGDGFKSLEICDDATTGDPFSPNLAANIGNLKINCRIATPGVVINEQLGNVLGSGFKQLELADEINEIIGALLGQLLKQTLGGPGGLSGLSRSSYSRPSYVDQLVQQAEQKYEGSFSDYGVSIIDGTINTEDQFADAKKESLSLLGSSENLLNSLSQCYSEKLSSSNPTLSSSQKTTATERMNSATATITASITPLQNLITGEIEQAESNISKLLIIRENLLNTTSQYGVDRVLENELEPFLNNTVVHSQSDLNVAQQQQLDVESITTSMDTTTNANLVICEAFPQNP